MTDSDLRSVTYDEDAAIVAALDALARRELASRSAMLRRAVRLLLASPATSMSLVPAQGNVPLISERDEETPTHT